MITTRPGISIFLGVSYLFSQNQKCRRFDKHGTAIINKNDQQSLELETKFGIEAFFSTNVAIFTAVFER